MAGHVAFGARTGGAPIILGAILLTLAFCFSGSIEAILNVFPRAVLGVILFLTGAQLALGSCDSARTKASASSRSQPRALQPGMWAWRSLWGSH